MSPIRFDQAWQAARTLAERERRSGLDVVVHRDLFGRVSLVLDDRLRPAEVGDLAGQLAEITGPFSAPQPVLLASEMFSPQAVTESADLRVLHERDDTRDVGQLAILERTIVGADWLRPRIPAPEHRVCLYGFKGGVGRSTATAMLAKHLAEQGLCVLVADLDLESPGVGELLQSRSSLSAHGLVDHLVEHAVGNAEGLELVCRSKTILPSGNGEVWLLPVVGQPADGQDYLAKLNRSYTEIRGAGGAPTLTLADRFEAALTAAEEQVTSLSRRPDVVLLDSRAGIHDIAAIAITQLSGLSLLFASENPHTWCGYQTLFGQWQHIDHVALTALRERLRMVAAMVPANDPEPYLARFRDSAQELFANTLYDDENDPSDAEAFNFEPDAEDAPHYPLPILFDGGLIGLNATNDTDWHERAPVRMAYAEFLQRAAALIIRECP